MPNNRLTLEDVADRVGVHQSTVSRALQNSPLISQQTKKRILDTVKKLKYRPNIIARSLAINRTGLIGLIIPDIKNPFCAEVIEYFEEAARHRNFRLILSITDGELAREEDAILDFSGRVDGIIINHHQSYTNCKAILELQREKFPFVLLGWIKGTKASYVMADLSEGAYLATRHLLELGHRRIAFMLAGNDNDILRLRGYKKALKEFGVEFRKELLVESGEEISGAERFMDKILSMKEKPTAIYAINDLLAIGIMDACEKRGLKIPGDFALVGFDNIKLSAHSRFSITTVDYPLKELAKIAMNVLQDQIEGRMEEPEQILIKPTLVVRRSSGAKIV